MHWVRSQPTETTVPQAAGHWPYLPNMDAHGTDKTTSAPSDEPDLRRVLCLNLILDSPDEVVQAVLSVLLGAASITPNELDEEMAYDAIVAAPLSREMKSAWASWRQKMAEHVRRGDTPTQAYTDDEVAAL